MPRENVDRQEIIGSFESIQAEFPHLTMTLNREPENIDVDLEIPTQPGLDFDVSVYLVGDELNLTVGRYFWVEWFPCTKESVRADFFQSVCGILSGRFRIVEYHRGHSAFKAVLERPKQGGWERQATWVRTHLPFLPADRVVLQNRQALG